MNAIVVSHPSAVAALERSASISLAAVMASLDNAFPAAPEAISLAADPAPAVILAEPAAPEIIEPVKPLATLDRKSLTAAVAAALRAVERRNTIPILSNVRLVLAGKVLTVDGTNLDTFVRVTVPAEAVDGAAFATTVRAHDLLAFLKPMKADTVTLECLEDDLLAVRGGGGSAKFQTVSANDFPELTFPATTAATIAVPAGYLAAQCATIQYAVSTEETRYYLNGAYLHMHARSPEDSVLRLVATDGHQMSCVDFPGIGVTGDLAGCIIPRGTLSIMLPLITPPKGKRGGVPVPEVMVAIEVTATHVRFTAGNLTITSKLIDGTFPDYARVIPVNNEHRVTLNSEAFADAVKRVSALSSERGRAVKLSFTADSVTLTVNNPEAGASQETIPCAAPENFELEIGFNARYVLNALERYAGDVTFALADAGCPCLITGTATEPTGVIMPMRV